MAGIGRFEGEMRMDRLGLGCDWMMEDGGEV